MGVKDLWPILTPYSERKPMYSLQGKAVAIDLAGWICESLNVVDYFIHPRQYLKNLFFRTCYLLLEGIVPVFVLEGKAPKLKQNVITKRNALQFRGAKPRDETKVNSDPVLMQTSNRPNNGRTKFNHVLKQCENLLNSMGIICVQGPGEAEAFCSYLNKKGLVDGVISQDSDCFAYGAITVYRNFSLSTQGAASAQGGAVDVYDMKKICQHMDFGQEKIIVLALISGCDYCDGVPGAGKDSVLKLFNKYKNNEILDKIKTWRFNNSKYSALEMRVDDKNVCSNCGHLGKTITHTKNGCSVCRLPKGCDDTLWKEERLSIKAELVLRKKALLDPEFPSKEIIDEFLSEPSGMISLDMKWKQPNLVKFIKTIGNLLQWTEIYCFQKFLPLLTRWQVLHFGDLKANAGLLVPDFICKRRTLKGIPSYEIVWKDDQKLFNNLIPDEQIESYKNENPKGIQCLWSTVEPIDLVDKTYPELGEKFKISKEKPKKSKSKKPTKSSLKPENSPLNNLKKLLDASDEISKKIKPKKVTKARKGLQLIDKFFNKISTSPERISTKNAVNCSTPKSKLTLFDLENDCIDDESNLSAIIQDIIFKPKQPSLKYHKGKMLIYEEVTKNLSFNESKDDLALLPAKRKKFINNLSGNHTNNKIECKAYAHDDISMLDLEHDRILEENNSFNNTVEKDQPNNSMNYSENDKNNVSFFFQNSKLGDNDEFEKYLDFSFLNNDDDNKEENNAVDVI